ncbi:MAG: hypothetical protein M1836_001137 [Candelina mexicana]|nr:MAG: hypothetical protein M1836_001137 [Candelina mexicana]
MTNNFLRELVVPNDPDVDIVAVHGLNPTNTESHAYLTWTGSNDKLWLKDFLPERLPRARVLLYGYNSNVAFGSSTAGVWDFADNLLERLYYKRKKVPNRPIIFVCHSLGGIVVKEALVEAKRNKTYNSIREATYAIVFFATPHQGGADSKVTLGNIAASVARGVLQNPDNTFMEALKKNSLFEESLIRTFRSELESYRICSFFETLPTKKLGLIVDKKSATLGLASSREKVIQMQADHSSICRFDSIDGSDFELVQGNIGELAEEAVNALAERERVEASKSSVSVSMADAPAFIVPYPNNPDFVGREDIFEKLQNGLFKDENESSGFHSRAALHGLGGVGKSQIAIKFAYWVRRNCPGISVFWIHASDASRFQQGFAHIATTCEIPGAKDPNSDVTMLVKTWLQNPTHGRWLMIIDNADDNEMFFGPSEGRRQHASSKESTTAKLASYLPVCPHGTILVTTRFKHVGVNLTSGRLVIGVTEMNKAEATAMMRKRLGEQYCTDDDLNTLSEHLEGLPLALAQAASYIQKNTITVDKYIKLLQGNDKKTIALLSEPFEDAGRDSSVPNAVAESWILTFRQIKGKYPKAAGLLSLMTFFDRQEIPQSLLVQTPKTKIGSKTQRDPRDGLEADGGIVPEGNRASHDDRAPEDSSDSEAEFELGKQLGVLKAYSLISSGKGGHTFDLHRLIQMVMRKWLRLQHESDTWARTALTQVLHHYPLVVYKNWSTCASYLPHSLAVLRYTKCSREERLARAGLLYNTAIYLSEQGQSKQAEGMAQESLDIFADIAGQYHEHTLNSMHLLCLIYQNLGWLGKAEDLGVRVLEAGMRVLGPEHRDILISMGTLALIYRRQGRHDKAEALDVQVLETGKRVLGLEHPVTLTSMSNLALNYRDQGRYDEAEALHLQVLKVQKRVQELEHPDTLTSMNNLALNYRDQGRYDEAEALHLQVLKVQKRVQELEHPDTLTSMNNLASTYWNQGRYDEAEALQVQVLEVLKRVLGLEHPDTLASMNNLALTYWNQGVYDKAEALGVQVLKVQKRVLGSEHPGTLVTMAILAGIWKIQGHHEKAMVMIQDAVRLSNKVLGPDHPTSLNRTKWLEDWQKESTRPSAPAAQQAKSGFRQMKMSIRSRFRRKRVEDDPPSSLAGMK